MHLLLCIKDYLQKQIIKGVNEQNFGPFFSIQCDEVTDSSNWEQLGIVIRYIRNHQPIEKLLEFVKCESISGEKLCEISITSLTLVGLDINCCRFQTMDGAANMAGRQSGCAARFTRQAPKAVYIHCASHDLNLALGKCWNVKEIHAMLDVLKKLGLFFKYSPKRTRRLEQEIDTFNLDCFKENVITKNNLSCSVKQDGSKS